MQIEAFCIVFHSVKESRYAKKARDFSAGKEF
jgi:hypothetical protein